MIHSLAHSFMKNEVSLFLIKFYGFDVVFCADSEYIFGCMIPACFCRENHEICVKHCEITYTKSDFFPSDFRIQMINK
jgi:hypothetical protein